MSRKKGTPNKSKTTSKPTKSVRAKQVKEVVDNLDELFGIDEVVNIDEMMSDQSVYGAPVEEMDKYIDPPVEITDKFTDPPLQLDEEPPQTLLESVGTIQNLKQQSHKESGESVLKAKFGGKNEELIKMAKFFHQHHGITMDKNEFELRFRFYMLKENLNVADLTYRRVMKFLREYSTYHLEEVKRVLNSL